MRSRHRHAFLPITNKRKCGDAHQLGLPALEGIALLIQICIKIIMPRGHSGLGVRQHSTYNLLGNPDAAHLRRCSASQIMWPGVFDAERLGKPAECVTNGHGFKLSTVTTGKYERTRVPEGHGVHQRSMSERRNRNNMLSFSFSPTCGYQPHITRNFCHGHICDFALALTSQQQHLQHPCKHWRHSLPVA